MVKKPTVYFHFEVPRFFFPDRSRLKQFILLLFKKEGTSLDTLHYVFCSDEYLLEINRQFLNHNYYTDIITFPLSASGEPVMADIYISVDRVRENAQLFHTSFKRELHRVIFHGALHLCGYKDKTGPQSKLMREKEEVYLKAFLVPRNTVSR
jgi:probable rRNA maturation factor